MKRFFFWMLVASGLGFTKVLVLAQVMSPSNLGSYVSFMGMAVLGGTLLSFGQIEGTTKYYPRLWLNQDYARITASTWIIATKLGLRFIAVAVVGAAVLAWLKVNDAILIAIVVAGIGVCTSYLALAASLLRAAENSNVLQAFNLVRNGTAILLACIGAWFFGWIGAMVGDLMAAGMSLLYAAFSIRRLFAEHHVSHALNHQAEKVEKTGGGKLYLAYLMSSSTQLLDRGAINLILGAAAAGSYGVVALMFQVGQLIVNIFAQRAGPRVIKSARKAGANIGRIESVRKPVLGMAALSISLVCAALLVRGLDIPPGFFEKYQISWQAIVFGGGVCFMQIFSLFEFHLIAHDRETEVLIASMIATAVMAILFALTWYLGQALEWFILAVFLARALHTTILWRMMNDRHFGRG